MELQTGAGMQGTPPSQHDGTWDHSASDPNRHNRHIHPGRSTEAASSSVALQHSSNENAPLSVCTKDCQPNCQPEVPAASSFIDSFIHDPIHDVGAACGGGHPVRGFQNPSAACAGADMALNSPPHECLSASSQTDRQHSTSHVTEMVLDDPSPTLQEFVVVVDRPVPVPVHVPVPVDRPVTIQVPVPMPIQVPVPVPVYIPVPLQAFPSHIPFHIPVGWPFGNGDANQGNAPPLQLMAPPTQEEQPPRPLAIQPRPTPLALPNVPFLPPFTGQEAPCTPERQPPAQPQPSSQESPIPSPLQLMPPPAPLASPTSSRQSPRRLAGKRAIRDSPDSSGSSQGSTPRGRSGQKYQKLDVADWPPLGFGVRGLQGESKRLRTPQGLVHVLAARSAAPGMVAGQSRCPQHDGHVGRD
jgi:hypothetical protein